VTTELNDLYQELILDHYRRPHNHRRIEQPDRTAEGYNPLCGDHVTVFLKLDGDVVKEVTFEGGGCAISTASASIMTDTLTGKTLSEAKEIFKKFHSLVTGESREVELGPGLGKLEIFSGVCQYPVRVKCATLAWHTFATALDNANAVVSTE
jgi:nitrogen fixation NifU-like protein